MSVHKDLPTSQIHIIQNWEVADNTERDALIVTSDDVGKAVFVTGDKKFYVLNSASPMAWTEIGGGDVVGPASSTSNNVVFFDGTSGKLIKDSGLSLAGSNTGDVTLDPTVTDVFNISSQALSADDPGADGIIFWDDSAGKLTHLTVGTNLSISGTTLNATGGGGSGITLGTPQATTSGSNIDFTGIPNTVKRITVMLNGVSLSGTDQVLIQLGTSSGVETTGYVARAGDRGATSSFTSGFNTYYAGASDARTGIYILTLMDPSSNTWVGGGNIIISSSNSVATASGVKSLGGVLDRIRLTVSGSNTFDGGSVNISYE
jgi:hypothetical protein